MSTSGGSSRAPTPATQSDELRRRRERTPPSRPRPVSLLQDDDDSPSPRPASEAPAGAYLGTTRSGGSLVASGDGKTAIDTGTGTAVSLISGSGSSTTSGSSMSRPAKSLVGGGGGSVDTTVNQKPPENAGGGGGGGSSEGPEGTSVNQSPRTDFSVVLAGMRGLRRNTSPYLSNNFVTLIGKAGGLGRKTSASKRSLIGGA